jgi:biotin operon repressor
MSEQSKIELTALYPEDVVVNQFVSVRKYLTGKDYLRVFSEYILLLAADKDLTGTDYRVFLAMLVCVDYDNLIDVSQASIADELKIHQADVGKSIRKFCDKGYLEIFATRGRQNVYKLNPLVGFKGRAKNYRKLSEDAIPPGIKTTVTS